MKTDRENEDTGKIVEEAYLRGKRAAFTQLVRSAMDDLGDDFRDHARLALVHAETLNALTTLCEACEVEAPRDIHPEDIVRRLRHWADAIETGRVL